MKTTKRKPVKKAKPKPSRKPKKLDHREMRFADELVSGKSVVNAAISAGYTVMTANKLSYKWIGQNRSESSKPELFDYVEAKRKKIAAKYELTHDRIAQELGKLIFTSVKDLYNENGQLKAIHEMTDAEANLIAGFEMEEVSISKNVTSITKKVKLLKKTEAISIANRMMGFNAATTVKHEGLDPWVEAMMQVANLTNKNIPNDLTEGGA